MPDHMVTSQGIMHVEQPAPYLDATIQQNGVTYAGRLYPVQDVPVARSAELQQRMALRSPDGKVLLLYDAEGLWAWSRRVREWQVFGWEVILRACESVGKK